MKWFSLIYQGDVHPSTDEKVIKHDAYSQLVSAEDILQKAREDADKLLQETEERCVKLKEEAEESGFQKGLESFNEKIFEIDEQLKSLRHNLQQMVLPVALKAAKKIVAKELEIFPETIVDIVMQAIHPVAQSHQVTIFVNKEDKALLEQNKPKLKEILEHADNLSIQEKADVAPGGCVIKTEGGMINATIENQWRALERAFEKYRQS